jgi:hypothetical protein
MFSRIIPGSKPKSAKRLDIHQQNLPFASHPPVQAALEALVGHGNHLLDRLHRFVALDRNKDIRDPSHGSILSRVR